MLVAATFVWGATFLVTRVAMESGPPLAFVALRFATAGLLIGLLTRPGLADMTRHEVRGGIWIGLAMLCGYGLLAASLGRADSGRIAFLAALYVPGVPMLQALVRRRWPERRALIAAGLACAGMMAIAGAPGSGGFGPATLLALGAAASTSAEIVLVGAIAPGADPRRLAIAQCATVALSAACLAWLAGEPWPARPAPWFAASLGLGLASAGLQLAANWALRTVSAPRAALIYAIEPVWAGWLGAAAGERMTALQMAGAAMIVSAMVADGVVRRTETTLGA